MASAIIAGYGLASSAANPTILEMHGEKKMGLIFGLEMLTFGIGSSVTPPLVGQSHERFINSNRICDAGNSSRV